MVLARYTENNYEFILLRKNSCTENNYEFILLRKNRRSRIPNSKVLF